MCLAIFKPAGVEVTEATLRQGWIANSGGAGFAHLRGKEVVFQKGFMKLEDFLTAYKKAASKNTKSPFLIHFRIPSMGHRNEGNTHPFPFKHGVLIHNGTIYGTGAINGTGPSDTAKFTDRYGEMLDYDTVERSKKEIVDALGHNKIAILYHDGRHHILNEDGGSWMKGAWYSNRYFLPVGERSGGIQ